MMLAMGYIHIPSIITVSSCIYVLHHINGLYQNVWSRANSCHFFKKIYMLLHDLSWIPIIMQSFTPASCLVFEMHLSKLNKKKKKNFEN